MKKTSIVEEGLTLTLAARGLPRTYRFEPVVTGASDDVAATKELQALLSFSRNEDRLGVRALLAESAVSDQARSASVTA